MPKLDAHLEKVVHHSGVLFASPRVFTDPDFARVDYEEVRLTRGQFEEYKKSLLGRPIPPQDVTDDELFALGYDGPEAWVQCCIEEPMPNWD